MPTVSEISSDLTGNPYAHLLYRAGWILTTESQEAPRNWGTTQLAGFTLSTCPDVPVGSSDQVTVLGRPIDMSTTAIGAQACAERLSNLTEDKFLKRLDNLTGRFVILLRDRNDVVVYPDTAGTKAVFYRPGVAASHPALAAGPHGDLDDEALRVWSELEQNIGVRFLPGVRTPYKGVRQLTPNTRLRVSVAKVERFWPREARRQSRLYPLIVRDSLKNLSGAIERGVDTWPSSMSLTAGLDSRLTLAAARDRADQIEFYSHVNSDDPNKVHKVDYEVAEDMAGNLGLKHRIYPMGPPAEGDNYDQFLEVWRKNLVIPRGIPTLIKGYVDHWPRGVLHLRSNVAEIGRAFYKGPRIEADNVVQLGRRWNPYLYKDPWCIEAFEEFAEITNFNPSTMMGYDPLDLFYWEHKVGIWHAWLCMESDMVHDTFPPYSNRSLLSRMLQAPFKARVEAKVFHMAIKHGWKDLRRWPINPKEWPPATEERTSSETP